ncbi:MAG: helicase-exonuclease AddAB subunit AddB [Clostridia bacterium]|nr:helicase-exonuclease AddAB subunit AddB [Clostridia bacterium]
MSKTETSPIGHGGKMGLRIIYGKPGSGKSSYCFLEIAKLIEKEKKIFVITPEQFSFTAEKKLMDAVSSKSVINAEVLTLSRMAYRVLNEIGGNSNTHLSKCGKAMLIYSILSSNKASLKFLGKSDENIDLVMTSITEFKKHGISIENLEEEIEKTEDRYLKTKLQDMKLMYESFENQIKNKYIDETDLLTILAKNLECTDLVKDSIIYIDEFSGFTAQEYNVLKELIEQAKQVNITMCIDINPSINPDTDIYYSNKITLYKLLNLVEENGLKLEEPIELNKQYRFKTKELQHLSDNIYNIKSTKYEENVENLQLFLAKNQYTEIENIAKEITKLVRDKELRYNDIAIITKNIDSYSSLVRAIFSKYNIPVFIDEKRDLNQNIIVQYILSILEVLVKNFSNDTIFNYIKLGFCDIEKDEIFKLENYCTKWGIKQSKWKTDFIYELDNENKSQEIERLNELRKEIINPLIELKEEIQKSRNAQNITKQLYEFIQKQKIEEKINIKIQELQDKNLIDLANEYVSSYKIILEILDEIVLVFGEDKITLDKYSKILKIGLKNSGLGKIPGTQDQVIFGDVDRSRSHKVKTVFIIGLNDGSFPSINKDEGFFNDSDRERLKDDGIELAKGTIDRLYEDNFNIYKAFTTAENNIYLSYASSDGEGKSLRPSILINKIRKMYPKLREKSDIVNKNYEIVNEIITYEELIENISKLKNKEDISKIWYSIYEYYKSQNEWKQKLENDLKGLEYTNLPNDIKKENIDRLYGNTLNTSISRLEKYRSCPFSYYLQYGLKLKEKEQLKIQSFNTGSFMHETIDEFFDYVKIEGLNLAEIEDEEILKIVSKIIEENLHLNKNFIFTATSKYKVLVQRLKRIVSKALKYIIETIIYSDFNIEGTEIEFGKKGEYKPIVLQLDDGKKVEITGKIDRIDTAQNEEGKYLRIIDYKSSAKNIDLNEVYAGLQIQLLTYTDAICRQEDIIPAGIFYFSLLEQMIKADKKISDEEIEAMIRKNFRMKGLIIADVKIIKMNDNTLKSGSSKLVPAALTSSGSINEKWTNGVKSEEFKILQEYIYKTIKDISKEILSGKIDLKPYNKKGKTPCEYCGYKSVCGFNTKQNNNKYNYIEHKSKDDIINKMRQEGQGKNVSIN